METIVATLRGGNVLLGRSGRRETARNAREGRVERDGLYRVRHERNSFTTKLRRSRRLRPRRTLSVTPRSPSHRVHTSGAETTTTTTKRSTGHRLRDWKHSGGSQPRRQTHYCARAVSCGK
ncbi:PREDICTED: uncharacterized protein LOC108766415 [Trachymyrmex cornetzi]|uniref:uncharacterized protein LOC108766415 n=1 Tax=Trachymyrmex cornetzi TaxID=471704 RepID=UPI00084EFBA8|nr:PREDICTED: uncharacterized protein LOC108766415 [Trachymyrmex cornetzi]